jgi:ABC-type iron transport system FetAB ATPase subunit
MAAAGIIFMPGMMTGQILGGQSPATAAAYQLMIYFGIASSRTLTAIFLSLLITARLFDLQRQAFIPWRWIPGLTMTSKSGDSTMSNRFANPRSQSQLSFVENADAVEEHSLPLLRVKELTVESTNLHVPLLELYAGDRIGLRGKSGVGKSQLLRAIARLDPLSYESYHNKTVDTDYGTLTILGKSCNDIPPAVWRSEIMWVCQDRPTIAGTPRDFYNEVKSYRSHRQSKQNVHDTQQQLKLSTTLMDIAKEWDLPLKTWDQPWNDISGGEAQRLSLAIALSLRPKLLLLDEPTSSCDADTTKMIERTLIEMNVTLLLVSHSDEQLRRLCHKTVGLR